jgi:hypothetical protein
MIIEKHDATVMTIEDPEKRGRIKVACVGLLGDEDTEVPQWIEPNLQWGWFVVPDPGEIVEIEAVMSDDQDEIFGQSSIENMELRWSGRRSWTNDSVEDGEPRPINKEFEINYGKRRGFATPTGHIILFDDTKGSEQISITWIQDDKKQSILFNEKGSIEIANANDSKINLDSENGKVEIEDENGNKITMEDGLITVDAQNDLVVNGENTNIETSKIYLLAGASESVVLGDTFKRDVFDIHTHSTAFGPSGPPVPVMLPTTLSQNCKVGG